MGRDLTRGAAGRCHFAIFLPRILRLIRVLGLIDNTMSEPVEEDDDKQAWLKDLLKPLRSSYREVFMMSLFINLLALAVPIFTMQTYDRVINS